MTVSGNATSTFGTGGFTIGTSQFVVVGATGNVGIGTTSPLVSVKLEVNGKLLVRDPGYLAAEIERSSTGAATALGLTNTNTTNNNAINLQFGSYGNNDPTWLAGAQIKAFFYDRTDTRLKGDLTFSVYNLATSALEVMRLTSSRNVGIGTPSPNRILQIAGNAGPQLLLTQPSAGLNLKHWYASTTAGSLTFGTLNDALSTLTERLRIGNDGRMGIGTTTPTTMFQVATSTANATTTVEFGKASQNKGSCLKMYDAAGTLQYVSIQGGSFAISATSCE